MKIGGILVFSEVSSDENIDVWSVPCGAVVDYCIIRDFVCDVGVFTVIEIKGAWVIEYRVAIW